MQRELTFYPEVERTRDLLYSEYTSQDRSIHVLLQDNSGPQYRFLLAAFREIVSRYMSTKHIQSPLVFLQDLAARLDELSKATQVTPDDFKSMGLYVLIRTSDAYYLFVSRDDDIFLHVAGEAISISRLSGSGVERVHFDGATVQEELFPDRVKDGFLLFRLDPERFRDRDIVLGCSEKDKSTVLEALSDPLWLGAGDRRNSLTSKFITRRVLVLRFDDVRPAVEPVVRDAPFLARRWRLVMTVGVIGVVGVGLWVTGTLISSKEQRAALQRPSQPAEMPLEVDSGEPVTSAPLSQPQDTTRLTEKWRVSFDNPVTSSPALQRNRVIFGCRDGNVYALDRETGERLWTAKSPDGIGASPAVSEDAVVVADYGGSVSLLAADTGMPKWERKLPKRVVSSPAVMNNRVVVGCYDAFAYCLSMTDGSILWKRKTGARIRASTAASDELFFVPSYDGYLYALSASSGEVRWRHAVEGNIASSPVTHRDLVIIGSPDGSVRAIGVVDGTLRWKYQTGEAVKSSPSVDGDFVYIGSNDKHVYCLNAGDGSIVWKYKTDNVVLSRPGISNGVVYVGSYDGFMYGLDAGTGKLLDRFQSDGEIYSSPVVDANAVYFGNNSGSFISLNHSERKAL